MSMLIVLIITAFIMIVVLSSRKEMYSNDYYGDYKWRTNLCLDRDCLFNEASKCTAWCLEQPSSYLNDFDANGLGYGDKVEDECMLDCYAKANDLAMNLDKNSADRNMWYSFGDFIRL